MTSKPMSDGGKGSVRRNEDNDAYQRGWDAIFGNKKGKTMMNNDPQDLSEDYEERSDEDYEEEVCSWCGGCGEGDYDGATCRHCHGTGIEPSDKVDDDYI